MITLKKWFLFGITVLLFTTCKNSAQSESNIPLPTTKQVKNNSDYKLHSPVIPQNIHFCNEPVPMKKTGVLERLDREFLVNMYWQSQTFLFLKRIKKWFPIIEPILKKHNIPDDFKYLAVIESGLDNVVSPSGAKGFWQFMSKTAKGYGLEVNEYVDERYHLEKSTEAACKYLKEAYEQFGSWTLAAASYNMGKAGLNKRLKQQQVNSYYDLLLNNETARYVYRILAVKTILSNPETYGFYLDSNDHYSLPPYHIVNIDSSVNDFVAFAQHFNLTYNELKYLNPWLRDKHLPNENHKNYQIKILEQ